MTSTSKTPQAAIGPNPTPGSSPQFQKFRAELEARGVTMRRLWETRRDGRRTTIKLRPDVTFWTFHGNGFRPALAVAIVIDYGKDTGFGFFVDEPFDTSGTITELAERIARPHQPAAEGWIDADGKVTATGRAALAGIVPTADR